LLKIEIPKFLHLKGFWTLLWSKYENILTFM